ncbi:MAG: D-amino-acid transaminase [Ignavibacteriaceae bacterium]
MIVYFNGKYVSPDEVKISPYDRGFQYADGVYEALRTYNGKLFRYESHMKRLQYSMNELNINFTRLYEFEFIAHKLAEMNNMLSEDFSVYIQITRGVQFPRKHNYEDNLTPTVFISVSKLKDNSEQIEKGVKVILEEDIRWTRCDIKSISILPSIMGKTKAVNSDAYEAIFHRDDKITEGSHTNFFAVKDDVVYTAPLSNFILEGITRALIIELCNQNKIDVAEDYIRVNELKSFDEIFITGTTTEVTPVIQINDWIIGNGSPGKSARKIQKIFKEYIKSI